MALLKQRLHLVILPLPAYGHIIPALLFANKLLHIGCEVTFICHEFRIKQVLSQAEARGCHQSITFRTLKRNSPGSGGEEESPAEHDPAVAFEWLVTRSKDDAAELREIMSSLFTSGGTAPSCLITDYLQSAWSQDVADELNIPRLVLYPSPALALAVVFHLRSLVDQGKYPIRSSELVYIPGLEGSSFWPLLPEDISTGMHAMKPRAVYEFYRANCLRIHDAAGVLCNTFTELEPVACKAIEENSELNPSKVPFLAVGPLLPESYLGRGDQEFPQREAEPLCMKWLDDQPEASVVYVSFGSLAKLAEEQVHELAVGLEASGERFLWVLPGDRVSMLPDGFKERMQERSLILGSWAPQLTILSHRSVAGFLSHCGWNSTMESVCHGKPMITMPLFAEQGGNAKMIVKELGVGVGLVKGDDGVVHRDVIQGAVERLMNHEAETLRTKANMLKQAAHVAEGSSTKKLVEFLNNIFYYIKEN